MFYKGSLDKLGIEADVIQIGPKYKNAPDQYTQKEMAEGQREVINAVLDEYLRPFYERHRRIAQEIGGRRQSAHRRCSVQRGTGERARPDRRAHSIASRSTTI